MTRQKVVRSTPYAALCAVGLLTAAILQPGSMCAQATAAPEGQKQTTESAKPINRSPDDYERWKATSVDRVYRLKFQQSAQDQNEILTAMRNMLEPFTKIFLAPSTNMIVVHAPQEEQERVAKLLVALDQPHSRYRLTYTLTELDGTHKIGVQHFSMVLLSGQRSQMKQGSRLPVKAGLAQFTYLDVGMNFDATLVEVQGGGVLKSKVEQTSIAPDSTTPTDPNPVLRQTQLEGTTSLVLNKPQAIGSLDVPSSTHRFDIEVVMEPVS